MGKPLRAKYANVDITFSTDDVDTVASTITVAKTDNVVVYYQNSTPVQYVVDALQIPIGGLSNGSTYFVRNTSSNTTHVTFQLSTTVSGAISSLTSTPSSETQNLDPVRVIGVQEMSNNDIIDTIAPILLNRFVNPLASPVSGLTLQINDSSNATSIGTFIDTHIDQPPGSITSETGETYSNTTYTFYQTNNVPSNLNPDVVVDGFGTQATIRPVHYVEEDGIFKIKEMSNDDIINNIAPVVVNHMLSNNAGMYYLQSSNTISGKTVVEVGTVTDTYWANSSTTTTDTYYLLQDTTAQSVPAVSIRPLTRKVSGSTLSSNLQEADNDQISAMANLVGEYIRTTGIGTYLLQESMPGVGTWQNQGTITNSLNTTSPSTFAGVFTGVFTTAYSTEFTRAFTGNYTGSFAGEYNALYTTAYIATFDGPAFTGIDYTGLFANTYTSTYSTEYTTTYSTNYSQEYATGYTRLYSGGYTKGYVGSYGGLTFTGIFTKNVFTSLDGYGERYQTSWSGSFATVYTNDANPYTGPLYSSAFASPVFTGVGFYGFSYSGAGGLSYTSNTQYALLIYQTQYTGNPVYVGDGGIAYTNDSVETAYQGATAVAYYQGRVYTRTFSSFYVSGYWSGGTFTGAYGGYTRTFVGYYLGWTGIYTGVFVGNASFSTSWTSILGYNVFVGYTSLLTASFTQEYVRTGQYISSWTAGSWTGPIYTMSATGYTGNPATGEFSYTGTIGFSKTYLGNVGYGSTSGDVFTDAYTNVWSGPVLGVDTYAPNVLGSESWTPSLVYTLIVSRYTAGDNYLPETFTNVQPVYYSSLQTLGYSTAEVYRGFIVYSSGYITGAYTGPGEYTSVVLAQNYYLGFAGFYTRESVYTKAYVYWSQEGVFVGAAFGTSYSGSQQYTGPTVYGPLVYTNLLLVDKVFYSSDVTYTGVYQASYSSTLTFVANPSYLGYTSLGVFTKEGIRYYNTFSEPDVVYTRSWSTVGPSYTTEYTQVRTHEIGYADPRRLYAGPGYQITYIDFQQYSKTYTNVSVAYYGIGWTGDYTSIFTRNWTVILGEYTPIIDGKFTADGYGAYVNYSGVFNGVDKFFTTSPISYYTGSVFYTTGPFYTGQASFTKSLVSLVYTNFLNYTGAAPGSYTKIYYFSGIYGPSIGNYTSNIVGVYSSNPIAALYTLTFTGTNETHYASPFSRDVNVYTNQVYFTGASGVYSEATALDGVGWTRLYFTGIDGAFTRYFTNLVYGRAYTSITNIYSVLATVYANTWTPNYFTSGDAAVTTYTRQVINTFYSLGEPVPVVYNAYFTAGSPIFVSSWSGADGLYTKVYTNAIAYGAYTLDILYNSRYTSGEQYTGLYTRVTAYGTTVDILTPYTGVRSYTNIVYTGLLNYTSIYGELYTRISVRTAYFVGVYTGASPGFTGGILTYTRTTQGDSTGYAILGNYGLSYPYSGTTNIYGIYTSEADVPQVGYGPFTSGGFYTQQYASLINSNSYTSSWSGPAVIGYGPYTGPDWLVMDKFTIVPATGYTAPLSFTSQETQLDVYTPLTLYSGTYTSLRFGSAFYLATYSSLWTAFYTGGMAFVGEYTRQYAGASGSLTDNVFTAPGLVFTGYQSFANVYTSTDFPSGDKFTSLNYSVGITYTGVDAVGYVLNTYSPDITFTRNPTYTSGGSYSGDTTLFFGPSYTNTFLGVFTNYTYPLDAYTHLKVVPSFAGIYSSVYTSLFGGVYTQQYTTAYTQDYTTLYTTLYTGATYTTQYTSLFATLYTLTYTVGYNVVYTQNYTGTYSGGFVGIYDNPYTGAFQQQYTGAFTQAFTGGLVLDSVDTNTVTLWVRIA